MPCTVALRKHPACFSNGSIEDQNLTVQPTLRLLLFLNW
uniref:Uncharacterized protein n=1 Tax=Arundo donax TaxID=35708 RepID=A0A0A9BGA1_ARUDO